MENNENYKLISLIKEKYYRPYIIIVIILCSFLTSTFALNIDNGIKIICIILIVLCFIALILFRILDFIVQRSNINAINQYKPISDSQKNYSTGIFNLICEELNRQMKAKKYIDVIRFGNSISRVLWLCMEYKIRTYIGKLIYDAAIIENDINTKIAVLIDDMGWTNLSLVNHDNEGIENIKKGIQLAEERNNYFYISKGNRHMANIIMFFYRTNNRNDLIKETEKYLKKAYESIKDIPNFVQKEESELSFQYSQTEFLIFSEQYGQAITSCTDNMNKYKQANDLDRLCKVYSQLGKIYLMQNQYEQAEKPFLEGIFISEKRHRIEALVRCYMGLAICNYHKLDTKKAIAYIDLCNNLYNPEIILVEWQPITYEYNSIMKSIYNKEEMLHGNNRHI